MLIVFLLFLIMFVAFFAAGVIWSLSIMAGVFKIAFFVLVCFVIWKVLFE